MDILMYVEATDNGTFWSSMGKYNPPRDFLMFGSLAGVEFPLITKLLYPPRGIPANIGWIAKEDYCISTADGYITADEAREFVLAGKSTYWNNSTHLITDPEATTPSWLTLEEYKRVLKEVDDAFPDYLEVAEYMQELETKGRKTRLVFWFLR
jgi:hypothetical protein